MDVLGGELAEERRRLATLRADYAVVVRSRFHALRVLWFSLKQLLGFASPRDRYAVWSPGITLSQATLAPPLPERARNGASAAHGFEAFVQRWNKRIEKAPLSEEPIVTIVIPVYGKIDVTVRCLESIERTWFESLGVQIVVVDDGSTDATATVIASLHGVDFVRNGRNRGFIESCNRGASLARGKYICFLNNDTEVRDGWLDHLVQTAENDVTVGAVGSKLIYPNGRLQEAGGIIWADGTGWNYGRNGDPEASEYNYVRDVDYCSGAALLVRSDLFAKLHGFSAALIPAYYEDADLCFGLRSLGYRVLYQPRSEVIHHEGLTAGTELGAGMKRYQEINRPIFRAKWADELQSHMANDPNSVPVAARRLKSGRTILIVDSYVPMHDKEAGSLRLFTLINILRHAKYNVIFLPENYAGLQPYTQELQAIGVEVVYHVAGGRPWREALGSILPMLDYAWICRPEIYETYAPLIRRNAMTKLIYDTIDLHFLRKRREAELLGTSSDDWKAMERRELACARDADATIVVSGFERELLETEYDVRNVAVIPTIHDIAISKPRIFEESSGLLFIGGYNHTPNVDAVLWFCKEVLPLIVRANPAISVTLLGANPPDSVLALESDRVKVTGYVRDVSPYFERGRVFIAPIRFGAGLKGKIGQSLSFGLPVVTTSIGAEGFSLTSGENCAIADSAQDFADAVVRIYDDRALWETTSAGGLVAIRQFAPDAVGPRLQALLRSLSLGTLAKTNV